jgi:hypothetical protein
MASNHADGQVGILLLADNNNINTDLPDSEANRIQESQSNKLDRIMGCWRWFIPFLQSFKILSPISNDKSVTMAKEFLVFVSQITRVQSISILFIFYTYVIVTTTIARMFWFQAIYVLVYFMVVASTFWMPINKFTARQYLPIGITMTSSIPITLIWQCLLGGTFSTVTFQLMSLGYAGLVLSSLFNLGNALRFVKKSK